jgi:hypothetical protein
LLRPVGDDFETMWGSLGEGWTADHAASGGGSSSWGVPVDSDVGGLFWTFDLRRRRTSISGTTFSAGSACSGSCAIVPPIWTFPTAVKQPAASQVLTEPHSGCQSTVPLTLSETILAGCLLRPVGDDFETMWGSVRVSGSGAQASLCPAPVPATAPPVIFRKSPSLSRPSPLRCGHLRCGDGLPRCREPLVARRFLQEDAYRLGRRTAGVDVRLTALRIALALAAWTSSSQPDSSSTSWFLPPSRKRLNSKNREYPSPSWITSLRLSMMAERSPFG